MSIDGVNGKRSTSPVELSGYVSGGKRDKVAQIRPNDEVQISDETQEFLRIRKLVDSMPDVRLDRVNALAKAIDQGTYNIKAEHVADAVIRKHLIDLEG